MQAFPIAPEKLIELAKKIYLEDEVGRKKPELLADNFRFEFPVVKLNRQVRRCCSPTFALVEGTLSLKLPARAETFQVLAAILGHRWQVRLQGRDPRPRGQRLRLESGQV